MLLADLFENLQHGELLNIHVGGKNIGGIAAEDWAGLLTHINMGLTALHRRFPIKFDEVIIQQYDEIQRYYLKPQFAKSNVNSTELIKYIEDSEYQPFKNNVIKIESVFSEYGEEYPLNDRNQTYSIYTPTFDCIEIPFNDKNNAVSVIYRANHDKIIFDGMVDIMETEVQIPQSMEEALSFYVANRLLNAMGAGNNIQEANHFLSKYELACAQIETYGLVNTTATSNHRLEKSGWV